MAQITYDEVNLMLRLYDMRREPRLRQARAWFVEHFQSGIAGRDDPEVTRRGARKTHTFAW